jgi:quinol monooxygenase YgiN
LQIEKGNPMSEMVHVIAVITTKPEMRTKVLEMFNANVPAVLEEDGCIEYGATIDVPDAGPFQTAYGEDTLVVIEKWASMAALMAHAVAPHMKAYGASTKDMLADRKIHIMKNTG